MSLLLSNLIRKVFCQSRPTQSRKALPRPLYIDPPEWTPDDDGPMLEQMEERILLSVTIPVWEAQGPTPITNGQTENIASTGPGPNPVTGAIHDIALHPTNSNIAYIGTVNGGIWQSTDFTSANPTYTPMTDHFPGTSIGALEFDPTDASNNTLYAGNGVFSSFGRRGTPLSGLLRTTDGGNTWNQVGVVDLSGRSISGIVARGNTILVAANNLGAGQGVYLSTDGGVNFNLISGTNGLGNGAAFDMVGDPTNVNRVYVSIGGVGIFRHDNLGDNTLSNWVNISSGDASLNGTITAGGNNNTEMAVSPTTGRIYTGVLLNGQVFYLGFSDNQGANWTEMDLPITNDAEGIFAFNPREKPGGQGAIHFSIVVDPNTATTVYVGGDRQPDDSGGGNAANAIGALDYSGRLFRGDTTVAPNNPGGRAAADVGSPQWEHLTHTQNATFAGGGTANNTSPHADSRDMAFRADGILVEVDDGGIYGRTSPQDNTGDWFTLLSDGGGGLQITEMHDIAYDNRSNVIMSGHQDTGSAQQATSGALTWTQIPRNPAPNGGFGVPVAFSTADGGDVAVDNLIGGGQSLRYFSIQNLGRFFRQVYDGAGSLVAQAAPTLIGPAITPQFVTPIAVNEVAANRLVIGGANGVFESTDRGDNVALVSPAPVFVPALPAVPAGFTRSGTIVTSLDYGAAANAEFLYAGFRIQDTAANQPTQFVTSGVFGRSAAGVMTQLPAPAGAGTLQDIEMDSTNGNTVYTVDVNQMWQSTDSGNNWTEITGNLIDANLRAIQYIPNPDGADVILVGGEGGVFRTTTDTLGTWSEFGMGLPNSIAYDLDYDAADDMLVVGTLGRGAWAIDDVSDFIFESADPFELNDTQATATILGSLPKITLRDLSVDGMIDVDFFKYTAQDTGKLVTNLFFDGTTNDLDLRVRDAGGNIIATGTQSTVVSGLDIEGLVIPVISQQEYWIEVFNTLPNVTIYDLEIENFEAPVPIAIDLAAADDTGMMNDDNVTSDEEGTITILADLFDFANMGIDILTPAEVAANEPGAAVEVFVHGQSVGIANPVAGSNNTLFTFQFSAGDLSEGLNVVTAAVRIFDGQNAQQDGRSQMSEPLLLTLDTTAPATPAAPDLLAASDTGMNDDDNVTAKMRPAFDGITEDNAKVRVKADGVVVGEGVATARGDWEVTVEPLDDGVYDITVEAEDLAGNVSSMSSALQVEIDTLQPNTAYLDLVEADDSGRHNDDNITNVNTPLLSATTHDPNAGIHLFGDNFKYRIYGRLEETVEVLLYDSFAQAAGFTNLNQIFTTANLLNGATILGPLADGIHNLKLEVEDRAGNISEDFLLDVLVDTVAPVGTLNLHPDSDSGIWGFAETMEDLVTSDMTPKVFGVSEADALVRVDIDDVAAGTTVAVPLDGDDAFPPPPEFDGTYQLQTILNLDDGEHTLEAFFRDVAGNESPASDDATITILVDTAGPRITNVTRGLVSTDNVFSFDGVTSLFEPKPSPTGPDPLIHSVVIHFSDLPDRTAAFSDVDPLFEALASEEGNYQIVGDHNGNVAIVDVNVTFTTIADDGEPETAEVELVLDAPLPDDRFTISVSDSISDPAGNPLDGESGALAPFDGNHGPDDTPPIFPTGDGEHGGDFHARFTVDSRPEIGTAALGTSYIDINGNIVFDPEGKDGDQTNRDIVFLFGVRDDRVFAGNFAPEGALSASGYDKLGSYGVTDGGGANSWHWRLDFDHDGVIDFEVLSGKKTEGDPVAGNFDLAIDGVDSHPGDEIGLFSAGKWFLDTTGNNNIGDPQDAKIQGDMRGQPIVGDFDGDGLDDLGTWNPGNQGLQTQGQFMFDLANNGLTGDAEQVIDFDLAGVFEQAVAADMNQDGIDDLGLFVTRREGVTPEESAEWFFLISDDPTPTPGQVTALDHPFTPVPFGTDLFAQFGDEMAAPIVGNFDPPVKSLKPTTNESLDSLANQGTSTSQSEPALDAESALTLSDAGPQPDAFTESESGHTNDELLASPEPSGATGRMPGSEPVGVTVPVANPLADVTIREAVAASTGNMDGSSVVGASRYSPFTLPLTMGGAYVTIENSQWPSETRAPSVLQSASGRQPSGEAGTAGTYNPGDWNWQSISFAGNENRFSRNQQHNDIAPVSSLHWMPDTDSGDMMVSLSALWIGTCIVLGGLTVIRIILEPRTSRT